jgi:hypothetical protein
VFPKGVLPRAKSPRQACCKEFLGDLASLYDLIALIDVFLVGDRKLPVKVTCPQQPKNGLSRTVEKQMKIRIIDHLNTGNSLEYAYSRFEE